jgi:CHASE3 domain sensor protein
MISLLRRHVRLQEQHQRDDQIRALADALIVESLTTSDETNRRQRELMAANQQALVLFIVMITILILICRHGFGWNPGGAARPPPATTVYLGAPSALRGFG